MIVCHYVKDMAKIHMRRYIYRSSGAKSLTKNIFIAALPFGQLQMWSHRTKTTAWVHLINLV